MYVFHLFILVPTVESHVTIQEPAIVVIDFNETATFNCTAVGGLENNFTWYYDGEEVELISDNVMIVTDDTLNPMFSELIISGASAIDGGNYTCNVGNAVGDDATANGTLLVRPIIITEPVPLTLTTNGSAVTLECGGEGFPEPIYIWEMGDEDDIISYIFNNDASIDFDFNPAIFGDEGTYQCTIVSEGAGNVTTSDSVLISES